MIRIIGNRPGQLLRAWRGGCRTLKTILHIGAHRTASTTFQAFLEGNAARLANRGIGAWTPKRTRAGLFSGLIRRPEEITLQVEQRAARSSGLIRVEIERHARMGLSHLIVSEENMIGAVRNNLRERSFYPLLDERLMRFRDGFADACTRVVMSVRRYDDFWSSSLAYGVAQGHRLPDAGLLDRLTVQPRRWRDIVRDVARTFPAADVVVWPFERFAGRPEDQLRIMTGRPVPANGLSGLREWRNQSPGINDLMRLLSTRSTFEAEILRAGDGGRWMPFDADQCHEMKLAYQSDLDWLRGGAEGFARFVEDPEQFDQGTEVNGAEAPAAERTTAPHQRGHRDEGPRRAMV